MTDETTTPKRLYKYRAVDARTLDTLVSDQLYFADPSTFNDPLETSPSLEPDISIEALEEVFGALVESRVKAEMLGAAKIIRYQGPKTVNHIDLLSRKDARSLLQRIAYDATNPELDQMAGDPLVTSLSAAIESELQRRYDRGIFSLAKRHDCPLMWSHYGDQHRGICVGYSVPEHAVSALHKVNYGGDRTVKASDVQAMLDGDVVARARVDECVLLKKAWDWRYEKEWRLIGRRGQQPSSVELEEVVFGMRCPDAIKHSVVRSLDERERPIKYFEIREQKGTFRLHRYPVERDELHSSLPRRCLGLHDMFEAIPD